jgi:hypothetical protein
MRPQPSATYRGPMKAIVGTSVLALAVWSSRDAQPLSVAVVLEAGEATVAWDSYARSDADTATVRAAYGPLIGRWQPPRAIGHATYEPGYPPISPWDLHMAVAPDGEVLLALNALQSWSEAGPRGAGLAWRAPRHPFGALQMLRSAPSGAIPQFDLHGTAYLHGYCNGFVMVAPPRSHQFVRSAVLTPTHVLGFALSLSGTGQGLASWTAGECSFDAAAGNTPGRLFASVLSHGTFAKARALTPLGSQAFYSNPVALPTGGGVVTWSAYPPPLVGTFTLQLSGAGLAGVAQQVTGEPIALAVDGGGDEVFGSPQSIGLPGPLSSTSPFVRPAGGGTDQPAPAAYGQVSVSGPRGRAAAMIWNTSPTGEGPTMGVSVWRP